jgi:hypothetical protein
MIAMSARKYKSPSLRCVLFMLLGISPVAAEEVITLESTIVGSQEQPRVLYIIPWKQANSLERLDGGLPQTIGDIFQHQEYSEFKREMELLGEGD